MSLVTDLRCSNWKSTGHHTGFRTSACAGAGPPYTSMSRRRLSWPAAAALSFTGPSLCCAQEKDWGLTPVLSRPAEKEMRALPLHPHAEGSFGHPHPAPVPMSQASCLFLGSRLDAPHPAEGKPPRGILVFPGA